MTKQEAISIAVQFASENDLPTADLIDARYQSASAFNELYGYEKYKYDFWIVEFWKRLPPEVIAETPGNVLIIVEEVSGRKLQAYPGWQ